MKSVLPAVLGIPAGELSHLAGVPAWMVIVVVSASMVLGLVKAIVPQDSEDRLHLLLALCGCRKRPEISPGITVAGQVVEHQEPDAPRSTTTPRTAAGTGRGNSVGSRNKRGLGSGRPDSAELQHKAVVSRWLPCPVR